MKRIYIYTTSIFLLLSIVFLVIAFNSPGKEIPALITSIALLVSAVFYSLICFILHEKEL